MQAVPIGDSDVACSGGEIAVAVATAGWLGTEFVAGEAASVAADT